MNYLFVSTRRIKNFAFGAKLPKGIFFLIKTKCQKAPTALSGSGLSDPLFLFVEAISCVNERPLKSIKRTFFVLTT